MSEVPQITFVLFGLSYFIVGLAIFIAVVGYYNSRRSLRYRKFTTDLFITGKVRQLAEKEKIDLDKEYLSFMKYEALNKDKRRKEIDDEIEDKISEEISKTLENKK